MRDGEHFTKEMVAEFNKKEITPITINRTFPVCNVIFGSHLVNRKQIIAKGRTGEDTDTSEIMTEGIRYVMDQNDGMYKQSSAFLDCITGGYGCLQVGINRDPRLERVGVFYRDWKDVYWDHFGDPWLDPERCRYAFHQPWIDEEVLTKMFPDFAEDIAGMSSQISSDSRRNNLDDDEATRVEDKKGLLNGTNWYDKKRKRVRPVEMFYTVWEKATFAVFPDGNALELTDDMPVSEQFQIIQNSEKICHAMVRKMRQSAFYGELEFYDIYTPFNHDRFPFVPFLAYTDRYGLPYGVPRQFREQNMEVNFRRTMALSLLMNRRVVMEDGSADDHQQVYDEANKQDGFIVLNDNKINSFRIDEHGELANSQVNLLLQSEKEIQEISGVNSEMAGYGSNATSGVAIEKKQTQGNIITSNLFDNERRSMKILGELVMAGIQQNWKGPKVLRVTDSLTGADRFARINEKVSEGGAITVRNAISQGRYDCVITDMPMTDTVRELYMQMINEAVKKSPPEMVPHLILMSFEISDVPNKEQLLAKIRPILGIEPGDKDMPAEEREAKAKQQAEALAAKQAEAENLAKQGAILDLQQKEADVSLTIAEVKKMLASIEAEMIRAKSGEGRQIVESLKAGYEIQKDINGKEDEVKARIGGQPPQG